ncbi:amino acid deaminase/aldolase [Streptomyces sp. Li-HN-5-11]|uniref:amino acid deaminase/aldolase n=1 Tax=Streptomyces sp. Li-HN-5-11 TaxID=3075432 RepID=UPI0028A7FFBC|nr:amino acid deaminase/aldolase [Streptomyces sp. Li-HN-5-11]WNM36579.1 amino acid deaminase/aldolase [Streptomyces sp. Li-HN-5-11]WOP39268.1 amino acid deaminase/aldolase [Streptomyces sp. Li-HN-5-13]
MAGFSEVRMAQLERATQHLDPPFAVVDLDAFDANAGDLAHRTGGRATIRLASKSVRSRDLIQRVLKRQGYRGILAFTLPEALWLAEDHEDVVIGYPTADRTALQQLAKDERAASRVTLMIDSVAQLDFIDKAVGVARPRLRLCIDLDASLELAGGRIHLGPYRSPVHTPQQAAALARAIQSRQGFHLAGVMSYEGQIAGMGDNQPGSPLKRVALRAMQRLSARELADRRAAAIAAVETVTPLEFVNGGGTGSVEQTSAEHVITEIGAGSGLYGPGLFDFYRRFCPRPAAYFVMPVVRRPTDKIATVLGGGWVASGPPGRDRLPTLSWPRGLRMNPLEGAGEVQTPVLGPAAQGLRLGDHVWFRHAKAGELCERVNTLHLVSGSDIVGQVPTYRGEGHAFL